MFNRAKYAHDAYRVVNKLSEITQEEIDLLKAEFYILEVCEVIKPRE